MKHLHKDNYDLYCGDCLFVLKQLVKNRIKVGAIIVDPPYGNTACSWDSILDFNKIWFYIKKLRKSGANIVIFSKQPYTTHLNYSNIKEFRYEVIWVKQQATNPMCAKKRIMPIHENISIFYDKFKYYKPQMRKGFSNYSSYFSKYKKTGEIYNLKSKHRECTDGSRYPVSVLYFNNVRRGVHPTQKPLDLMEYLVKTYTKKNQVVLDFTMGSGTTGVACLKNGRKFIGIEKELKYYKIAKSRMKNEN